MASIEATHQESLVNSEAAAALESERLSKNEAKDEEDTEDPVSLLALSEPSLVAGTTKGGMDSELSLSQTPVPAHTAAAPTISVTAVTAVTAVSAESAETSVTSPAASATAATAAKPAPAPELPCTACGVGLGKRGRSKKRRRHPLLGVAICADCLECYESGEFIVSEEDQHEIYCRWCGDGGELVHCGECVCSFCVECLKRNLGAAGQGAWLKRLGLLQERGGPAEGAGGVHGDDAGEGGEGGGDEGDSWACFLCAPHQLEALKAKYAPFDRNDPPPPAAKAAATAKHAAKGAAAGHKSKQPRLAGASASASTAAGVAASAGLLAAAASSVPGQGWASSSSSSSSSSAGASRAGAARGRGGWVVSEDISLGRERRLQLRCVNEVDLEPLPPFVYVPKNVESAAVRSKLVAAKDPDFLVCCDCEDGCRDPNRCACMRISSGPRPAAAAAAAADGAAAAEGRETSRASFSALTKRLMEPRTAVYECHAGCRCSPATCPNRVVGLGPSLPLEVFRCTPPEKGWGVRCRDPVPAGTFVAAYQGELLDEVAVEQRGKARGDEYLFNLDLFALDSVDHRINLLRHRRAAAAAAAAAPGGAAGASHADGGGGGGGGGGAAAGAAAQGAQGGGAQGAAAAFFARKRAAHEPPSATETALARIKAEAAAAEAAAAAAAAAAESPGGGRQDAAETAGPAGVGGGDSGRQKGQEEAQQQRLQAEEDEERNAVMDQVEASGFLLGIDAKWWGNVGRFFNHSCGPNMEKQAVFVQSQDVRVPTLAFFTNSDVPAGTELTYNYGYVKGSVEGKQMICRCGEQGCIERMY